MHALLASDESEVGAEFQNEGFQFSKDGVLNVLFDVVRLPICQYMRTSVEFTARAVCSRAASIRWRMSPSRSGRTAELDFGLVRALKPDILFRPGGPHFPNVSNRVRTGLVSHHRIFWFVKNSDPGVEHFSTPGLFFCAQL